MCYSLRGGLGAVELIYDATDPRLVFAAAEIRAATGDYRLPPEATIILQVTSGNPATSFSLTSDGSHLRVIGADATEKMYGGLQLADNFRIGRDIFAPREVRCTPFTATARYLRAAVKELILTYPDLARTAQSDCAVLLAAARANVARVEQYGPHHAASLPK